MAAALLLATVAGCSDDDEPTATSTTAGDATTSTTVGVDDDPSLQPYLLTADVLPDAFARSEEPLDDTITAFCAGEDATAGLSASGRAAVAFTRTPPGASVIQIVYRFDDDGAAAFVEAAEAILGRCSDVPDLTGLAFTYEPLAPEVESALAGADQASGRYGTSVGSESLTIDIAALRHGDVGQLVAVLGVDVERADLDRLAAAAFRAAASGG